MHPYIPHLLEDIRSAHRSEAEQREAFERSIKKSSRRSFEEEMASIEDWVAHGVDVSNPTLAGYAGLDLATFPPVNQLSEEDMLAVYEAMHRMAFTYNHDLYFKDKVPAHLRYSLMLEYLAEPTFIPASGSLGNDYCSGNPDGCRLGAYCDCIEYRQSADRNTLKGTASDDGVDELE